MRTIWIIILLFFVPGAAHALCVGTVLQAVPGTVTFSGSGGEYNVFDPSSHLQTLNFQVASLATLGGCRYYMVLTAGSSGATAQREMVRGGDTLDYNVYTSAAQTNSIDSAGNYGDARVISGSFPFVLGLLQTNPHTAYWSIDPLQVVSADPARFQDSNLTLEIWAELALGIFTRTDTETITFQARAESSVDLSLVSTGGAFNIADTTQTVDFGALSSGAVLAFDTIVRSNDGYIISMQSQNAQKMLHEDHPAVTDFVGYALEFAGAPVNLSSGNGETAIADTGTTPAAGERFDTRFTINPLSGAEAAGHYQDVITVTVTAN